MLRWLTGRGASPRAIERQAETLTADLWRTTLERHDFLAGLTADESEALRQRTAWLLASKSFSAAQGLELTDTVRLSIAVQAALPILALEPERYEGWTEIIVYPGGFLIPRQDVDEAGVVHEYLQEAAGEAWDGGPLVLSWHDVDQAEGDMNVVIHEFAHKLDLHHGPADGQPDLSRHPELHPRRWRQVLEQAFTSFQRALEAVEAAIPPDIDPESEAADAWYGRLPLDPYAATDPAEFFAVSSEAFFVAPQGLVELLPDWYALLAGFYRQDPWQRWRAYVDSTSTASAPASGRLTPGK